MKDAIIDDVTLGRRVKAAGGRTWLGIDPGVVSLRGYASLGGIVDMVARTAFTELRYRYSLVALTWIVLGAFYMSPPVLALWALGVGSHWVAQEVDQISTVKIFHLAKVDLDCVLLILRFI